MVGSRCVNSVGLQVEYYLSDKNLAGDKFFRKQIIENNGWVSIASLLKCNQIKSMHASKEDILSALAVSHLEIAPDFSAVRRSGNAPLPPLVSQVKETAVEYQETLPENTQSVMAQRQLTSLLSKGGFNGDHSIEQFTGRVWWMARNCEGTRTIQNLLKTCSREGNQRLVLELKGKVWESLRCPHANYVIQEAIFRMRMEPSDFQFIINELMGSQHGVWYAASHISGCRILLRLLEHCSHEQFKVIFPEILKNIRYLCKHQYGNHVIQHLLVHRSPEDRMPVALALLNERELASMARSRFGHDVLKHLLQVPGKEAEMARDLLMKILQRPLHDLSRYERAIYNHLVQETQASEGGSPTGRSPTGSSPTGSSSGASAHSVTSAASTCTGGSSSEVSDAEEFPELSAQPAWVKPRRAPCEVEKAALCETIESQPPVADIAGSSSSPQLAEEQPVNAKEQGSSCRALRVLKKKLRQIVVLKEQAAAGKELQDDQKAKISTKMHIEAKLGSLQAKHARDLGQVAPLARLDFLCGPAQI